MTDQLSSASAPASVPPAVLPAPPTAVANAFFERHRVVRAMSLLAGLVGLVVIFILLWPDRFWLRCTSLLLAGFYLLWGTLTHTKVGTFSAKVFWEYASVAGLGALMLWLII